MSDRIRSVSAALELLVPSFDDDGGSWEEIVRRADSQPTTARRSHLRPSRRKLLLALAALILVVLFATPAFGLQQLVLDLIGRKNVSFQKAPAAPNRIKKQFADLGIGSPPRYVLHVLAGQARNAGSLSVDGKKQTLWVAPTKGGGYCYDLGGQGGCSETRQPAPKTPVSLGWAIKQARGQAPVFTGGAGEVYSAAVMRLELRYHDGTRTTIPFIWVSKPIAAGFFAFHVHTGKKPAALVAFGRHGRVLMRATPPTLRPIHFSTSPGTRQLPRRLPAASTVHPTAPLQQATAEGVSAVAGANGAVQFTANDVPAAVRNLLKGSVSFSCFRLTREFGIPSSRGYGTSGAFAASVGFQLFGVGRPLDGCEIISSRGHRWPDALGSHAPVELAFTTKGHAYFADRAAARDLALFVRSRWMQQLRKEQGQQLLHAISAAYGQQLTHSRIRIKLSPGGVTFSETSTTGKRFQIVIRNRRIRDSNVEPYAQVF